MTTKLERMARAYAPSWYSQENFIAGWKACREELVNWANNYGYFLPPRFRTFGDEEELPAMDPMLEDMVKKSIIDSVKKRDGGIRVRKPNSFFEFEIVFDHEKEIRKWESAGGYLL